MYQVEEKMAAHACQMQQMEPETNLLASPSASLTKVARLCGRRYDPRARDSAYQGGAAGTKRVAQQGIAPAPLKEDHSGRCDLHDAV